MPLPTSSEQNPILAHERAVWLKGLNLTQGFDAVDSRRVYGLAMRNIVGRAWAANQSLGVVAIWQPVAPVRDLVLLGARIALYSASVATVIEATLRTFIVPPTGGAGVAPVSYSPSGPAPETLAMNDPTSAPPGTVSQAVEWSLGVTGAASVANPPPSLIYGDLFAPFPNDLRIPLPAVGANANRGWMIALNSTVAATLKYAAQFVFAEPELGRFL